MGGAHRSGWPYVVSALRKKPDENGILLDDYAEGTFRFHGGRAALWGKVRRSALLDRLIWPDNRPPIWREPWVGIFHHPPNLPEWFDPVAPLQKVFANDRFRVSRRHLRGAIALSQYTADWLQAELSVPVTVIKHPTEFPSSRFTWEAFESNLDRKLVQVGWYLRNYRAIYQVEVPETFQKVHLAEQKPWIKEAWRRTDQHSPYSDRPDVGSVHVESWLENEEYDRLLSENVIFMEVFDASANNAVIESIVRNTPIVVNRHPAIEEYLGTDYPLFYSDIGEVKSLLDSSNIKRTYEYLKSMDKSDLRVEEFVDGVSEFVDSVSNR